LTTYGSTIWLETGNSAHMVYVHSAVCELELTNSSNLQVTLEKTPHRTSHSHILLLSTRHKRSSIPWQKMSKRPSGLLTICSGN